MSMKDWWPKIGAVRIGENPDTGELEEQHWVTDGYGCWWEATGNPLENDHDTQIPENRQGGTKSS